MFIFLFYFIIVGVLIEYLLFQMPDERVRVMTMGRFGGQFGIHEQSGPGLEDHHMRHLQPEHRMHR